MQQAINIASARVLPFMSAPLCRYEGDDNYGIEKEALRLQADVSSGGVSKTRSVLNQLKQLAGMVGRVGKKTMQVQGIISNAIAKAQKHLTELEMEERATVNNVDAQAKFEMIVYVTMSPQTQKFYDSIDAHMKYTIAPVNDHGHIVSEAAKNVDGKTLKRLVSLIRFHSLDTDHKKKILSVTFGAGAAEGEGTPKNKALLIKKRKELLKLHDALDDMEAYKAFVISHKYRASVAAEMIRNNHEVIAQAHEQIDEVRRKYDILIRDIDNSMAMATLKAAKLKMKRMLNHDVIECVMLEQKVDEPSISGGVSAIEATPNLAGYTNDIVLLPPLYNC